MDFDDLDPERYGELIELLNAYATWTGRSARTTWRICFTKIQNTNEFARKKQSVVVKETAEAVVTLLKDQPDIRALLDG